MYQRPVYNTLVDRLKEPRKFLQVLAGPGRVQGTRELIVSGTPFIVVYRVNVPAIQILRVLHHARKWPVESY